MLGAGEINHRQYSSSSQLAGSEFGGVESEPDEALVSLTLWTVSVSS